MYSFSISYATPFNVPAPYSYEVSFHFLQENKLNFDMHYSNRNELSEDEILNEGFSENDDFVWSGNLNSVWKEKIDELLAKSGRRKNLHDQEIILKLDEDEFAPNNYKEWNVLIQDLIQAVFETSKKEKLWSVEIQIIRNGNIKSQKMNVSFEERKVELIIGNSIKMDWIDAKKLMELIYLGDFDETKAFTKLPSSDGIYLCFDDITWYKVGVSINNPFGNKSYLGKLSNELERFF